MHSELHSMHAPLVAVIHAPGYMSTIHQRRRRRAIAAWLPPTPRTLKRARAVSTHAPSKKAVDRRGPGTKRPACELGASQVHVCPVMHALHSTTSTSAIVSPCASSATWTVLTIKRARAASTAAARAASTAAARGELLPLGPRLASFFLNGLVDTA